MLRETEIDAMVVAHRAGCELAKMPGASLKQVYVNSVKLYPGATREHERHAYVAGFRGTRQRLRDLFEWPAQG